MTFCHEVYKLYLVEEKIIWYVDQHIYVRNTYNIFLKVGKQIELHKNLKILCYILHHQESLKTSTKGEKIFENYIFDMGPVSRIYRKNSYNWIIIITRQITYL